ncbi:GH25 family lysozyme [Plantactinospora sp. KBS50]|uniref:GH25 family lysozyme n=1 Tax=Plantactinospora sp. KBS50 TaxID=2024580 RepID=UPI0012FE36F0|nr:GH25 family lysozyme [Plantactinospora sp. KBS50]
MVPAGYTIKGIDVSSNDHNLGPIDWSAQAADGVSFAYVKASEGLNYLNPYFEEDYQAAKDAGILAGAYHYARPDKRDPVNEANYFLDHAHWLKDSQTLVPMLDIEWPYFNLPDCWGLTPAEMSGYLRAFADRVEQRIGRKMLIYTNTNWWNACTDSDASFGDLLLNISGYTASLPPLPSGWSAATIWQYAAGNTNEPGNYDKNVFVGDYPALTRLTGAAPAVEPPIGLLARANNRYVTADSAGTKPLVARGTQIGLWEQYDMVAAGAGYVALRSHSNGLYVSAESAGTKPLVARSSTIGGWEEFAIVNNADGSLSLLAHANGNYVTAPSGGTGALIANRTAIGAWEKFDKYAAPRVVSIRSVGVGAYVTAESAGTRPLIARSPTVGQWERYDLIDAGQGYVALRSHANDLYVTAESAGTLPLIARSGTIGGWERFALVNNADGTVSLLAKANGLLVTAVSGTALMADTAEVTPAQEFQLLTP